MYLDWGYTKLYERLSHEMDDERQHADLLIQRILLLGGTPNLVVRAPIKVGSNVPDMMTNDLDLEKAVIKLLREAIAYAENQALDYTTGEILVKLLRDSEEDHGLWLEQQLGQIKTMGLATYLQSTL